MFTAEFLLYFASALAGTVIAFPALATQRNWPRGRVFETGWATFVYLTVMITGASFLGGLVYFEKASWLSILFFILFSFAGSALVPIVLGRHSGWIALILSIPVLVAAFFVYMLRGGNF